MQIDPRTVAREIPGVLDEVFPLLTPGIVAHFNASAIQYPICKIPPELLALSQLQRAMLFELGYVVGEHLLQGTKTIDWDACFQETLRRQRAYYDAKLPKKFEEHDQAIAAIVGSNIAQLLTQISRECSQQINVKPKILGFEWIATGYGDFSVSKNLIEVKCSAKNFSAADYRQVAIYWMLSYAASIEGRGEEWEDFTLLNPRSGHMVKMRFDIFLNILSSGRTKVDILQLFRTLVGSRLTR